MSKEIKYLTQAQVDKVQRAAGETANGLRNAALVLVGYRHGMRASELVNLRWDQIDFATKRVHFGRLKNGKPAVHALQADTLAMLRALRSSNVATPSDYVFVTDQGKPISRRTLHKIISEAGERAGIDCWPHQLRHTAGHLLAEANHNVRAIQDYLGHKNILHTERYTQLSANKFAGFWSGSGGEAA